MNKQQLFNKVATHLIQQGKPSAVLKTCEKGYDLACLYRGPEGTMCAVGCLISNEEYDENMEHMTVHNPVVKDYLYRSGINIDDREIMSLLRSLQSVHDNVAHHIMVMERGIETYQPELKEFLEGVAFDFKLNTEVLNVTSS